MTVNKKNGFTLVEIIAVIVILALLITIAVPSVINISTRIKSNIYCSKVNDIIEAAKLYGKDYQDELDNEYLTISVYNLIEYNYLKKEDKACDSRRTQDNTDSECVKDPRTNETMDNIDIVLAKDGKKIGVRLLDEDSARLCKNENISSANEMKFVTVSLDPNEGELLQNSKVVANGLAYGLLPTPKNGKYFFEGWYTQKEGGEKVLATTTVTAESNHTLYAHWSANWALLDEGPKVNGKLKALAANISSATYDQTNNNIVSFIRSNTLERNDVTISAGSSPIPIYAWFDSGNIYWYSESEYIFANENSSHMFDNLNAITRIDLSNINTSVTTNMSYMFANLSSLNTTDFSNFDTTSATNMSHMFENSSGLKNINLNTFVTDKVLDMSYMFNKVSSLTILNLRHFNNEKVTDMNHMFSEMTALKSLNLTNFVTSNVTNMEAMFYKVGLESVDLKSFDTSKVTNMNSMFKETYLRTLDLNSFNTSSVTDMSYMLYGNISLNSLNVTSFNTSNVENMSHMFENCNNVQLLNFDNFNTSKVTNMNSMFKNLSSIKNLNVSSFDTSNVTNMEAMFANLSNIQKLNLSSFNTSKVTNMNSMFLNNLALTKINVDESNWNVGIVSNSTNMFSGCTNIKGGNGTTYNSSKIDKTYARVDTASNPGYLTSINGVVTIPFTEYLRELADSDMVIQDDGTTDKNMRFIGQNPNNYVTFNGETAGWRIIGVFNKNTHGMDADLVKLVKATSIGSYRYDTNNNNDWANASLKNTLNNNYYNSTSSFSSNGLNSDSRNMIENVTWKYGGSEWTTSDIQSNNGIFNIYNNERSTRSYSGNSTSSSGYIALSYISDLLLATNGYDSTTRNTCLSIMPNTCITNNSSTNEWKSSVNVDSRGKCTNGTWMAKYPLDNSLEVWTLSIQRNNNTHTIQINPTNKCGPLSGKEATNSNNILPSFYLKSDVICTNCDEENVGSQSNPYQLALP